MMFIALTVHILAAVIWIGGMFFAYAILRPSAGPLEPGVRLALWSRVLSRFFPWVWLSVAALLVSGGAMIALDTTGTAAASTLVRLMMALGLVMIAIYAWVYFTPWQQLRRTVSTQDWVSADQHLQKVRFLVGLNLALGVLTVVVGISALLYG
jgi:uncharacterized membrane protein